MKKLLAIALAVLMLAGLATVAFAAESPDSDIKHTVTITLHYADGTEELYKKETVNHGDSVTIEAPEKAGNTFEKMTISGDYTEAKRATKEYTTPSVTITPNGDIDVVIYYTGANTNPSDNTPTSPETGVNYTVVALAVVLGIFGAAVATKKLFER